MIDRIVFRKFSSALRLSSLTVARYSSIVAGFRVMSWELPYAWNGL